MATIVNDADVALQATSPRLVAVSLASNTSVDFSLVNGTTKPSNNADVTSTVVNGGVVLTGGGFTLSSGGSIKGGQSGYNTGTGWFLGYSGGQYKMSLGNPAGHNLTWDGSTLSITGAITLTNTIAASSVTGLAATATSSDFASVTGTTKPSNNADVTLAAVNGSLVVTGGGITFSAGGAIKGGQSAYNTGTGFFLGYSGDYKMSLGNPSGHNLTWDGSTLAITGAITLTNTIASTSVTGLAATATSSDFASVTGATKPANNADVTLSAVNGGLTVTGGGITLSAGGAVKGGQSAYNTGTGFFIGYSSGYKLSIGNSSGNKLTWDGSNLSITGAITGAASIDITGAARFGGALTSGGLPYALVANEAFAALGGIIGWANSVVPGVTGSASGTGAGVFGVSSGGVGVLGNSSHTGSAGVGGVGTSVSSIGGTFSNNAGGIALYIAGKIKIDVGQFGTGGATGTFVGTNKPGTSTSNSWLVVQDDSGAFWDIPAWPR